MNRTTPNFYEQYGLTRVREAMKQSFNEAFPAWVQQPATAAAPAIPQLRTLPEPSIHPLAQPIFRAQGPARGLAPIPSYSSSEPLIRNKPVLPRSGQPEGFLVMTPEIANYRMPPNSTDGSLAKPVTGVPIPKDYVFVPVSFGNGQPPIRQEAQEAGGERPAKRRRVDEVANSTSAILSPQAEELPVWHESKLDANENPSPYEAFFGVKDKQGMEFVKRILSRSNEFKSNEERINFAEKMFSRLSSALERRQRGIVQISDAELGKLVTSIFDLSRKIHRQFEKKKAGDLKKRLVGYAIQTVNNNLSIVRYLKTGLSLIDEKWFSTFGGKAAIKLTLWCYENNAKLNQKEINYLSRNKFFGKDEDGELLLKKLREKIGEEEGSTNT